MKLHMILALIGALVMAETTYAGCGCSSCTSAIGPPAVSCSTPCCPQRCCRLFPTLPQVFAGVGRLVDCLIPCHGCGPRGCGPRGCGPRLGSCCHSPMLPACRPRPCAACLWPSLHCCTYRNMGHTCGMGDCGSGGYSSSMEYYDDEPALQHYGVPHEAPAVPEALQDAEPEMAPMMMNQQTRYSPRRGSSVSMNAPQRPIERTSLQRTSSTPQLIHSRSSAAPQKQVPTPAAKPIQRSTSTRINSRITPASHEVELNEPEPISEVAPAASPLRQLQPVVSENGLPANPLR